MNDLTTQPAATWRDYTFEPCGDDAVSSMVICRSEEACEGHHPSAEDQYLTLGEAVDWAQAHAAKHAQWELDDAVELEAPAPVEMPPSIYEPCGCLTNDANSHRGSCPAWETRYAEGRAFWVPRSPASVNPSADKPAVA
jgi:hypothetical protein